MKMTVLRTAREDDDHIDGDMYIDIEHQTEVPHVDVYPDDPGTQQVTIYGTETNGQLYYVVLDLDLVRHIQSLPRL